MQVLNSKLDELIAASRRLGRKDWLMAFLGVMMTIAASSVISPDTVQHLIGEVGRGLMHLFVRRFDLPLAT